MQYKQVIVLHDEVFQRHVPPNFGEIMQNAISFGVFPKQMQHDKRRYILNGCLGCVY